MKKLLYFRIFLTLFLFTASRSLVSQAQETEAVPETDQQEVKLFPNWDDFSLESLGTFTESGQIGTEYNDLVGYDVSRTWTPENTPDEVLKLGDLQSLAAEDFTLAEIIQLNNPDQVTQPIDILNTDGTSTDEGYLEERLAEIPLSDFSVVEKQTLADLVEAVPDLGAENAADVLPIADLLSQAGYSSDGDLETLATDEEIGELELSSIDLSAYTADEIPGLEESTLGDFEGYEESFVSEVPGLSEVPLSEYPEPLDGVGNFSARIDALWGGAESNRNRTISGSYVEGFNVSCESNCEHLELDDLENAGRIGQSNFEGKQWIAGRENWVAGGTGCMAGGREPTGIHPFEDAFKTVLWSTDETTDTATVMMFFNIKSNCGESAYFIGPIPFPLGIVRVNDWVYLGTGV